MCGFVLLDRQRNTESWRSILPAERGEPFSEPARTGKEIHDRNGLRHDSLPSNAVERRCKPPGLAKEESSCETMRMGCSAPTRSG